MEFPKSKDFEMKFPEHTTLAVSQQIKLLPLVGAMLLCWPDQAAQTNSNILIMPQRDSVYSFHGNQTTYGFLIVATVY